ncbi:MAG TPA: protein-disulfide reductase DsbD [Burkholderiales bacterium]|nr:protein-disulfide reductase DsbD [Burkholderiales bacterium]
MRALLTLLFGLFAATAAAQDLLEPEKAFRLSARAIDATTVEVRFDIARGYYMYRDKFAFAVEPADVKLGPAVFPKGEIKKDEFFGLMETYRKQVAVTLPVSGNAERLTLEVTSQGCADIGVCYPPQVQTVEVKLAALASGGAPAPPPISSAQFGGREVRGEPGIVSDEARFEQALLSGNFLLMLAAFFGAGILLAFTPCVLPMVPILSGIIIGEGRAIAKAHAFALSLTYVLGMALTYTVIGILAALSGTLLSATLQNPWVLGAFAAVFVALAASMFGFYELQLPAVFHSRVAAASQKLKGGEIAGVALMGVLSAAIVSPCVAAPLAGALLYISQTRDVALGGAALFSLALGMGVPLIVVGVTGGALLPKSGHWMKAVKTFFGFMLLGLAIWIVAPVIPAALHMLAWAALLIIGAMYLHALDPLPEHASGYARFWKGVGVIALLAGTALVIGALAGSRDVLQPLAGLRVAEAVGAPGAPGGPAEGVRFERVSTVAELDARLKNVSRPVMLDFYADWCVSCKEMERFTFSDAKVKAELAQMVLLQVDVTKNTPEDQQLLKRYRLFGPPGIIFFDKGGREIPGLRVIGYQPADKFLHSLALARSF